MMATVPLTSSSLLPLLESLEDITAGQPEQTDAYLTIVNRLSGDDGTQFLPAVVKNFSRLGRTFQTHIASQNAELSQAALQALGFCVFHANVVSAIPANFAEELLSALSSLVVKSTDKNTCTRALWVISKQNFPPEVVAKMVPDILRTLECVRTREDIQSVVIEHESLNVIIRLLDQTPAQMGECAVQWAKLVIPLVVHSASKVRLRAAAALEMGLPLLMEKQKEVAAIIEPIMSSKLIPELQKLFSTKNETNVLKLWPLFVRLLGKLLHRGGPFINSLLGLEELGFRSSSPNIKKIAFIAWKSLIDNFSLNPEILCSAKRLKLLLQPLRSIQVRTEALLLTKLEVWWYLVVKLGPNLPAHFEQCTLGTDSAFPTTPARSSIQNSAVGTSTHKTGAPAFSSPTVMPRLSLNCSVVAGQAYPSIQLLGLEMLLHYFMGSEVTAAAAKNQLTLSLEPLVHPFLSSPPSFTKHGSLLISAVRDSFICIGKDAPAGHKKERQGSELLPLLLQALQSIISSEALPAHRALSLLEMTVKGIPQRILGSASYQVGKMDLLNGTPALFLILLFYNSSLVGGFVEDERFFLCLETLVSCGLSGLTSPLAFGEAVLGAVGRSAGTLGNKEQLWRMWSVVVNPLTVTITQTNEVNQGDALEHNFSAVHTALMFPITHLLPGNALPHVTQKSMLGTWSRLYKVFACCSALVATAEENVCCEELCGKMAALLDRKALRVPSTLDAVANILLVIVESSDFSPYTSQFQQKMKSPHTPLAWVRKKSKALGNLSTFQTLLVQALEAFNAVESPETVPEGTGLALVSILSTLFSNLALATAIQEALASLTLPLTALYEQPGRTPNEQPKSTSSLGAKLEKLLVDVLGCLQTCSALAYDDELLSLLSPLLCVLFLHRRKHIRSLVTQFWNATFANALVLVYPEELKPVLSQVKQNTPILLPGFQSVEVPDELSGQYSSESSQLETKVSGVQVTPGVKRDSLLVRVGEMDRSSKTCKPVSMKLDFGSPKPPRREELEEQASIDFVFIPPETKERVLTEHQKEVKRTKRVDIPAMYNNLDASLDTTAFTQYTQSQEESLENPQIQMSPPFFSSQVPEENMEMGEDVADDTQEYISPTNETTESEDVNEDVLLKEDSAVETREDTSPDVSGGSDMVSGTPQKTNSRRQSFITLEKYAEGKPASPASVVMFTGPLTRTANSQAQAASSPEPPARAGTDTDSQETEQARCRSFKNQSSKNEGEKPEPSEDKKQSEVEKPAEKRTSETDEDDVIPDTQTPVEILTEVLVPAFEEVVMENNSQKEESQGLLEGPPSSQADLSQGEPRRSGRRRSRPLRPGEDAEEWEEKDKRRKSQPKEAECQMDSPKTVPSPVSQADGQSQGRASRRSKLAVDVEDCGKDKLRKISHKEESELSRSNSQVATPSPAADINSQSQSSTVSSRRSSKSEDLVKDQQKRGVAEEELSQSDSQTDTPSASNDSQSQSRCSKRSKLAVEVEDDCRQKLRSIRAQKVEEKTSQIDSHVAKPSQQESQSQGSASWKSKPLSDLEEVDFVDEVDKQDPTEHESDSQIATPSPADQTGDGQSQGRSSRRSKLVTESEEQGKGKPKRRGGTELLSQIDSQTTPSTTPSATPTDSQSQGRASRRSKVPIEVAESEVKRSLHLATDSAATPEKSQTHYQVAPSATSPTDRQLRPRGRTSKRNKMLKEQVKANNSPNPTPNMETENSQVADTESSQGSGRTKRHNASQALLVSNVENSESDASEPREDVQKGRKPTSAGAVPSPLATVGSAERGADQEIPMDSSETSLKSDSQNPSSDALEVVKIPQDVEEALKMVNSLKPEVLVPSLPVMTKKDLGQRETDMGGMVKAVDPFVPEKAESENAKLSSQQTDSSVEPDLEHMKSQDVCMSRRKKERGHKWSKSKANFNTVSSQESDHDDLECDRPTQIQRMLLNYSEQANSLTPSTEGNAISEDGLNKLCTPPIANGLPTDTSPTEATEEKLSLKVSESSEKEGEETQMANNDLDLSPLNSFTLVPSDLHEAPVPLHHPSTSKDMLCQDSPPKQKDTVMGLEVGHSPSSGRTRGLWSPLASPSTSILKKGQKRPIEEESPSPFTKSRRVSFADPIQHQELADDIDRRSPVIRSSSPRNKTTSSSIPQAKYITTPTKGLLILSPRNLRSPGYKSSKKCLISELGQEPRPIPKDCVYPALVRCSTPVEAVLPQITSNMWPRGFGQLVRARNIKTVGDLSALTPSEIKNLPIRSPKISNVKKALKIYHEQQQKGRSDELKSFEEMEKLTSELEEPTVPQNQGEDKTPGDEHKEHPEERPDQSRPDHQKTAEGGLLLEVESLAAHLTGEGLSHCSSDQLVLIHDQLGGMMRTVVLQLQSRLLAQNKDSGP
uniref:Telomere-associated protein Rif1 N-terminal domain-containing protein n=1 Tax=Oncorhynchus tshawytscha TaxID=74940 RepID=A0A8C8K0Z0_ONCTS